MPRPILSRPRTRLYDANYNMSENYYRPVLDGIDRKYYGRPLSPPRRLSLPRDILDRHDRAFAEEELETSRRRAEKHITEANMFDSRGGKIASRAMDLLGNDIDEETASSLSRIRANKKVSIVDDVDMDSTVNNIKSLRMLERSDKLLDSVGLSSTPRRALDDEVLIKKRSLKVRMENEGGDLVKWTPLVREVDSESAAAIRAKQSKDRLMELEDEMAAIAEKQSARERRAARLKALVAESTEETEAAQAALQSSSYRFRARREQENVE